METNVETTKSAPRRTGKKAEKSVLKQLCSSLKVEPKAARRKLRKAGLSFHTPRERWVFTEKQLEQARAVLRPDLVEKAAKKAARAKPADEAPAADATN